MPSAVRRWGPFFGLAATGMMMMGQWVGARVGAGVKSSFITRRPDGAQLDQLAALCEAGAVRPIIDRVLPLDAIAEAHAYSETGRARGKIVVSLR